MSPRPKPAAVLIALMFLAPIGSAQTGPRPIAPVAAVLLAEAPLIVHGIGLTLLVPAESSSSTLRIGDNPKTVIMADDESWRIKITAKRTSDPKHTLRGVADSIVEDLIRSGSKFKGKIDNQGVIDGRFADSNVKLIERIDNLSINETAAERFYLLFPGGQAQPDFVRGFTIFRIAPNRYCIFELETLEPEIGRTRGIFETVVGTAVFTDPGKMAQDRAMAVKAGVALFKQLAPVDYENAIAANNFESDGRWERLFSPAPGGADADARELGYREIRAWRGSRGELKKGKGRGRWAGPDHDQGYLVSIRSRVLDRGQVIDSNGRFFMSQDRQSEAWTLDLTIRDPNDPKARPLSYNEVGAREGKAMNVTTRGEGLPAKMYKPLFTEEGYISQVERYLLGPLLMQTKVPNDFAFYAWNSLGNPPSVTLLRASLNAPEGATGVWTMETRSTARQEPTRTFFREDGTMMRQDLPDNPLIGPRVWKPITGEQLKRIWKEKGLPMGD